MALRDLLGDFMVFCWRVVGFGQLSKYGECEVGLVIASE